MKIQFVKTLIFSGILVTSASSSAQTLPLVFSCTGTALVRTGGGGGSGVDPSLGHFRASGARLNVYDAGNGQFNATIYSPFIKSGRRDIPAQETANRDGIIVFSNMNNFSLRVLESQIRSNGFPASLTASIGSFHVGFTLGCRGQL